jgi:hypothetical protein
VLRMMLNGSVSAIVMLLCIPECTRSVERSRQNTESRTGDHPASLLTLVREALQKKWLCVFWTGKGKAEVVPLLAWHYTI